MSDITLTTRLTDRLTKTGATALLTIINATRTINTSGRPINQWAINWQTGKVFTTEPFQVGTDPEALPETIGIDISATIPAHMILAPHAHDHGYLSLHESEVWSVEDLACHDLRTFQLLEFGCDRNTHNRILDRMRAECSEQLQAFTTAPNPFDRWEG
jgi:hypothetical protein